MAWEKVGQLGELQNDNGDSLVYGEFGSGSYGLYTTLDGHDVCMRVDGPAAADELLAKIASGWRPINWDGGAR